MILVFFMSYCQAVIAGDPLAAEPSAAAAPDVIIGVLVMLLGILLALGGIVMRALVQALNNHCATLLRVVESAVQSLPRHAQGKAVQPRPDKSDNRGSSEPVTPSPTLADQARETNLQPAVSAIVPIQKAHTFRVQISRDLLPEVHNYVSAFLDKYGPEMETGVMLVGDYETDAEKSETTFQIRGFIEAGPKADFSSGSILFDAGYQASMLQALRIEHARVMNLGVVHRHPGCMDVSSEGDRVTDMQAVNASNTKALVFGIITINNPRPVCSSLVYRNFKFDFYLMAQETNLEYVRVTPTLVDLPIWKNSQVVKDLLRLRGAEIGFDLSAMQEIPSLGRTTVRQVDDDKDSGLLFSTESRDDQEKLHIWIQAGGSLNVWAQKTDGNPQLLAGPWEVPEIGQHIWLSHVLLAARERRVSRQSASGYASHYCGLLHDKQRLVAEVRAMNERYGSRATLRKKGDLLYWEYVIAESGRSFPIRIEYPEGFPAEAPRIISVKPLPPSPHQLGNNELCWINHFGAFSEWNPARDTAVICVAAAARWFGCLMVFLTTGRWPEGAER